MKFYKISAIAFSVILASMNGAFAGIQEHTSGWQEAVNEEIPVEQERPIEQEIPVKEAGMEPKEGGNAALPSSSPSADKVELKSFDPFASDKPDNQPSVNPWNTATRQSTSEKDKTTSNLGDRASAKTEDNQSSILTFNLMLNWLNKFKTNQEMQ